MSTLERIQTPHNERHPLRRRAHAVEDGHPHGNASVGAADVICVDHGPAAFMDSLNRFRSLMVKQLALEDMRCPGLDTGAGSMTPVTREFESLARLFDTLPDKHNNPCANPHCHLIQEALFMSIQIIRATLECQRKSKVERLDWRRDDDGTRNLWHGVHQRGNEMESEVLELFASVLDEACLQREDFERGMRFREQACKGEMHGWDEPYAKATTVSTCDVMMGTASGAWRGSSDNGDTLKGDVRVNGTPVEDFPQQIDHGTQFEEPASERDDNTANGYGESPGKAIESVSIAPPEENPAAGDEAMSLIGAVGDGLARTHRRDVEDEEPWPFSEASYSIRKLPHETSRIVLRDAKDRAEDDLDDHEGIRGSHTNRMQGLGDDRASLMQQKTTSTTSMLKGILETVCKSMARLALGEQLPESGRYGIGSIVGSDRLLSHLRDQMKAWTCMLSFLVFGALEVMEVIFFWFAYLFYYAGQHWSCTGKVHNSETGARRPRARAAKPPSMRDLACIAQHIVVILTLQNYLSLQRDRDDWLQMNGLTRKRVLAYSTLCPSRWNPTGA